MTINNTKNLIQKEINSYQVKIDNNEKIMQEMQTELTARTKTNEKLIEIRDSMIADLEKFDG